MVEIGLEDWWKTLIEIKDLSKYPDANKNHKILV